MKDRLSMKDKVDELTKQLKEMNELSRSIRNLLILNLSQTDIPHENIAKAAHMAKGKLYDIIPKKKKSTKKENRDHGRETN
jgi:hypothetical protein